MTNAQQRGSLRAAIGLTLALFWTAPASAADSCCTTHDAPGCETPEVQACVCGILGTCCTGPWTAQCVAVGTNACGQTCSKQDCCTTSQVAGCTDSAVESCTCGLDAFCCANKWDEFCVSKANAQCGAKCGVAQPPSACCDATGAKGCPDDPTAEACVVANHPDCATFWNTECVYWLQKECQVACPEAKGACCSTSNTGGCTDPALEACVCAKQPECCESWTGECAALATTCGAPCEAPTHPCCGTSAEKGCAASPTVEACVCAKFPGCCTNGWTAACTGIARDECGANCPPGDCCSGNGGVGCDTPSVEDCVCDVDATCCTQSWSVYCADIGHSQCGACADPAGSCCAAHPGPGCSDPQVNACVCAYKPYCCEEGYDGLCATIATGLCGAECPAPAKPKASCCTAELGAAGCVQPAVEACVCKLAPGCCSGAWSPLCAVLADQCGAGCASLGSEPCCASHTSTGCDQSNVEACVCGSHPECCTGPWTTACVSYAATCGAGCVTAGCCAPHEEAGGCADSAVSACVCAQSPGCCSGHWDTSCIALAHSCGAGCLDAPDGEGACLLANGSPGCSDNGVESCVCAFESFCCEDDWDSGCVDLALTFCGASTCGDGICTGDEGCGSCTADCGCEAQYVCWQGECAFNVDFAAGLDLDPSSPTFSTDFAALVTLVGQCEGPSLERCTSPTYLATPCGRALLEAARVDVAHPCHAYARTAGTAAGNILQQTPLTTAVQPVLRDRLREQFRPETPLGTSEAYVEPSPGDTPLVSRPTPWASYLADPTSVWAASTSLASCAEYLFQLHFDWHRFEDQAAALGTDYRAVFQLAYGAVGVPSSVATRMMSGGGLKRRDGSASRPFVVPRPRAKNPFHDIPDFLYVTLSQHYLFNASVPAPSALDLRQQAAGLRVWSVLRGGMNAFTTGTGLEWHAARNAEMAQWSDETLYSFEPFKQRFRSLALAADLAIQRLGILQGVTVPASVQQRQHRLAALSGLQDELPDALVEVPDPNSIAAQQEQVTYLVNQVVLALLEADALGCVSDEPTPCDWSPQTFVEAVTAAPLGGREQDLERCYDSVGATPFSALAAYQFDPVGTQTWPVKDYTTSTTALDTFVADKAEWLAAILEYLLQVGLGDSDTGQPRTGKTVDDGKQQTDEWFGYDYDYHMAWDVLDLDGASTQDPDVDFRLRADFDAEAKVFGRRVPLANLELDMAGTDEGSHNSYLVEIFGYDLYQDEWTSDVGTRWSLVDEASEQGGEERVDGPVFPIAGVPVRLSVGLGGVLDTRTSVVLDLDGPSIELTASFKPHAEVYGFVEAAVDYTLLRAGVRGEVVVLGLSLPLELTAVVGAVDGTLRAQVTTALDLVVETLNGRFKLFAEIDVGLWKERFEKTIATWQGYRHTTELFHANMSLPLLGLVDLCTQTDLVICPSSGGN